MLKQDLFFKNDFYNFYNDKHKHVTDICENVLIKSFYCAILVCGSY